MTNKNDNNKKVSGEDLEDVLNDEMFSNDVMESCNKMLENLSKNPNLINKTVKNFMQTFSGIQEGMADLSESNDLEAEKMDQLLSVLEEISTNSKRTLARLIRLEKRMEKADLIKPSDD